jgi:hypothetical protein
MMGGAPAGEADDNLGLRGSRQGDNARMPMSGESRHMYIAWTEADKSGREPNGRSDHPTQ